MIEAFNDDLIFQDRNDAGGRLAVELANLQLVSPIVIALPRGGIFVAKPVADKLNVKLDIMVAKKVGAPENPELAVGAVTSHGDCILSAYVIEELGLDFDYVNNKATSLIEECKLREQGYKENLNVSISFDRSFNNKTVLLIDDGTATGMTALAAIKSIRKQNPKEVIMAIPVISQEAYQEISRHLEKIIALKVPSDFIAVGAHFRRFDQVSDEEIKSLLGG